MIKRILLSLLVAGIAGAEDTPSCKDLGEDIGPVSECMWGPDKKCIVMTLHTSALFEGGYTGPSYTVNCSEPEPTTAELLKRIEVLEVVVLHLAEMNLVLKEAMHPDYSEVIKLHTERITRLERMLLNIANGKGNK